MNLPDMHQATDNSESSSLGGHPAVSFILYALSWLFMYFQSISADEIWTWVWRGLSLLSLLLIIYINWSKAGEIFRAKNSNRDKSQD